MLKRRSLKSVVLLFLALAACGPAAAVETATPAASNTPEPTWTLPPTRTPAPTQTNTPKPTNTPRPTATKTKVPTATATLEPIVLTGSGDSVVDVSKWDGASLAHITYSGSGNFSVWNYDAGGEKIDLLVNTIGKYDGIVTLDFLGSKTARFEVTARSDWQIEVLPLDRIRRITIPTTVEGIGDDVVMLEGAKPDLLKIDASQADRNFAIWGYGNSRDLLANEIAPYTGTALVSASLPTSNNRLVLAITATGPWSIEVTTR